MRLKLLAIVSITFLLSGCSIYQVDSQEASKNYYSPKKQASEVVYEEKITRPHEIIGYVTVSTERRQNLSDVMEKMQREAAILGGDAITNIQTDATGTWKRLPAQEIIGNGYVRANFTAAVVVLK